MESKESFQTTSGSALGTAMMLMWVLIIGPFGALILGGVSYFIMVENVAAGMLLCGLLFVPLVLTLVWGAVMLRGALRERKAQKTTVFMPRGGIESPSERLQSGYS